jgi:hypothetical protein
MYFLSLQPLPSASSRRNGLTHINKQQSQSNRGENQPNRPNSQGYGAVPGASSAAPGGFGAGLPGQQEGGDAQGYNLYGAQPGHNGAGAEY